MNPPKVSVLIITWNSATTLPRCLEALAAQSFRDFEVVVVDNGSTDGCTDGLEGRHPALTLSLRRLEENRGYAAGNNLGAHMAKGEWLALLNADAFPEPDWLGSLVEASARHPDCASFASRLILAEAPEQLDGEGDIYHVSGLAWRRNHGKPASIPAREEEVFSACGAAALLRKDVFLQAGGFDEQYFAYNEDIDLGFRLRLAGQRCLFVPAARVLHVGSASTGRGSEASIYHGHRNLAWTFFKDMPTVLLLLYLPAHFTMTLSYLLYFTLTGRGSAIWRAKRDALRGLPRILRMRNMIQSSRKIPVSRIRKHMNQSLLLKHWAVRLGDHDRTA